MSADGNKYEDEILQRLREDIRAGFGLHRVEPVKTLLDAYDALRADLARVERERDELRVTYDNLTDAVHRAWAERDTALASAQTAERHLGNLLARIHRDGGHYQEAVGTDRAVQDAHEAIAQAYGDAASAQGMREALGWIVPNWPGCERETCGSPQIGCDCETCTRWAQARRALAPSPPARRPAS